MKRNTDFVEKLINRYRDLRKTVLSEKYLRGYIDGTLAFLGDAVARDSARWYIEVFGILSVVTAFFLDMLNVRFALLFTAVYAVFGAVMSLTSFFARTQTLDLKLSFPDVLKAVGLCVFEVTVLRSVLAYTRFFALFGYGRKKRSWGKIERKKIDFH